MESFKIFFIVVLFFSEQNQNVGLFAAHFVINSEILHHVNQTIDNRNSQAYRAYSINSLALLHLFRPPCVVPSVNPSKTHLF